MDTLKTREADASTLPTPERLRAIHQLYQQGLYRQAYYALQPLAPIARWRGSEARVMAGRLAAVLGTYRLGMVLHLLAHREHPSDPLATYYAARATLGSRGPWAAWKLIQRSSWSADTSSALLADVAAFRGYLLAQFRDFQQSRSCFAEALRLAPERPWIYVERSSALALEDRYDEALQSASFSLKLQPWNRPGVQSLAHFYHTQGREREAIELLEQATERLECGETLMHLARLHESAGNHASARDIVDRAANLLPMADEFTKQRLDSSRSDSAYHCGDERAAIEFAERIKGGFFETVAKNLRQATSNDQRRVLAVPFVRQHHLTCAPATLTSIAHYWNCRAEHLQIAEAICYDGTPGHSERRWAEQSGFVAREFTADWPTAMALIDRGVPFTFTTVAATTSHLQAVVGYDARRRTLLFRDPATPQLTEMLADQGLAYYRGFGPRGMVLVPRDESQRLQGIELCDAELYDDFYLLQQALESHDRSAAQAAYQRMVDVAGDHRLTLDARRTIAVYDADRTAALHSLEQSLQATPDSPPLLFAKLCLMQTQVSRAERLAFLESVSRRNDMDSIFRLSWAEELADDARQHPTVRGLLKRLLRQRPAEARCYSALAGIAWTARRYDEATELYRFAACLDDRREQPSRQYFIASRHVQKTGEALDWLEDRIDSFGSKSSLPAQSLYWAYESLDRTSDAFRVLDSALARLPADDTLPLLAADAYARYGKFATATDVLNRCRGRVHEGRWLRAAALLAGYRGELAEALANWREVVARDPQSAEAVDAVARHLEQIEGRQAALHFWQEVVNRFPHNIALLRAAVEWVRNVDLSQTEGMLDRLLQDQPTEPWARRERAVTLAEQQRLDEALIDADLAIALDPAESYGYSVRGSILSRQGRVSAAADSFRLALEHSVDNESAIHSWLADCRSHAERSSALEFFYQQLVKQTTFGNGLLAYADLARHVLDGETLLSNLRAGLQSRPDLWHAWSAVVRQLVAIERLDEATSLAQQMVERFPLLPGAWADLATTCQVRGDVAGEVAALEKALEINCQWTHAIFRLVAALTRINDLNKAQSVVEQALRRLPHVAVLHGYRADLCWRLNDRDAALAALRRAVELDPDYYWGWETLQEWAAELGRPELAHEAARSQTEQRPGDGRSWYWLARILSGPRDQDERFQAARRAIELSPRWPEAHALYSRLLVEAGRFDEAIAACQPAPEEAQRPQELRAQEAAVLMAQGKRDEAVQQMRSLLADNQDYVSGWFQLAGWAAQDRALRETHLEAARQLVRLLPHDAEAWRHLGEAAGTIDSETAKMAWTRALQVAPAFRYAANWLFDLQFADKQYEAADETLSAIEAKSPDPFVWARRVQLATAAWRPDKAVALEAFEKLCATDCAEAWPLSAAVEFFAKRYGTGQAKKVLRRNLTEPQASRFVLAEWVSLLLRRREWFRAKWTLSRYSGSTLAWNLAAERMLTAWASSKNGGLPRFVRKHSDRLRADTDLWGTAGHALHARGYFKNAVRWLGTYRNRGDARPWILTNLAMSLRELNRDKQATDVHQVALTLPRDDATYLHESWLAVECAERGENKRALQLLSTAEGNELMPFYQALRCIARNTVDGHHQIGDDCGRFDFWRIEREYRHAIRPHRAIVKKHRLLMRAYVRNLRALLRAAGYRVAAVWLPWVFPF